MLFIDLEWKCLHKSDSLVIGAYEGVDSFLDEDFLLKLEPLKHLEISSVEFSSNLVSARAEKSSSVFRKPLLGIAEKAVTWHILTKNMVPCLKPLGFFSMKTGKGWEWNGMIFEKPKNMSKKASKQSLEKLAFWLAHNGICKPLLSEDDAIEDENGNARLLNIESLEFGVRPAEALERMKLK